MPRDYDPLFDGFGKGNEPKGQRQSGTWLAALFWILPPFAFYGLAALILLALL